jgi:hypothetical protein
MANPAVEIANLQRRREQLFAERDRLESERDALIAKARIQSQGGDREGATTLRDLAARIETQLNGIEEQIGNLSTQIGILEQQQTRQDKEEQPQTTVSGPAPPTEDPTTKQVDAASNAADVNTNSGDPGDPGPAAIAKKGDNSAQDDNPQTANTSALGQPVATTAATPVNSPASKPIVPQPNILDRFASYTYQAAVYLLTPEQLNALQTSQKKSVNGYNLLFQSGGAPNNIGGPQAAPTSQTNTSSSDGVDATAGTPVASGPDAGRNPFFPNDFYIDTITIENVPLGKGTMAAHGSTQLKFTVIEPANITLLDCMYQAVQNLQPKSGGGKGPVNYAAACYLMVIRFYGYDEQGRLQKAGFLTENSSLTDPNAAIEKYIPFRIKNINWEVSNRLVSYEFDCQPIGQIVAGGTRRGTIPADVEISGQTVGELLVGSVPANNASATAQTGLRADENQTQAETNRLAGQASAPPKAAAAQQKSALRTGIIGAMNAQQQKLLKMNEVEIADEYEIVFATGAEKIRDATVTKPGSTVNKGATDMGPAPQQNPSGLSPDKGAVKQNSRNQGITAGMQLLQVIDLAIRNSNYITDQATTVITEGSDGKSEANGTANSTSFLWYHIAMSVQQLGYDFKRRDFAYRVRYTILPYAPQDFQSQYFPQPKFRGVVKSYPYWFTGQNTAVLDYRASFNKMYHLTVSGSSAETSLLAKSRQDYVTSMRDLPFVQYQARSTESSMGAAGRANELAANAAEYLYNPADNGQAEMTIIGDPAWIQQGSSIGQLDPKNINYDPFNPDGTINFDTNDVLFEIVWQRPEDYDLGTGLADPYARTQATFGDRQPRQSVIYRAINVVSEFRQGRFQQKLKGVLYRYPVPGKKSDADTTASKATGGSETGLDASGRQTSASDTRVQGRSNQSLAVQLRTGVNLNSTAGAGRGIVAGPTAEELAAYSDAKSAQTAAARLSSSATPSARPAPTPNVTATPVSSGEFSAPTAESGAVSPLPPAQPVTSNGATVTRPATNSTATANQSGADTARLRRAGQATAGALNLPQQGARDY